MILFLGEGARDVGLPGVSVGDDHEGDIPRLVRRMSECVGGPARFGYQAATIREVVENIPRAGRPTRSGGKAKDLRDAILASLPPSGIVVAIIDARLDEIDQLQGDVREILRQCQERSSTTSVVVGLAVQEIEIWMLVDPHSRTAAGISADVASEAETHPDPKSLWASLCGMCPVPNGFNGEQFADMQRRKAWEALRPEVVTAHCPRGFGSFFSELAPVLRALRSADSKA